MMGSCQTVPVNASADACFVGNVPAVWISMEPSSFRVDASQMLDADAHDQWNEFIAGADAVLAGMLVGRGGVPRPDRSDDVSVGGDRAGRPGSKLEREHPRPVSLIGHRLGDPADPAIAAALHQGAVEQVVRGSPREEVIVPESLFHA